MNDRIGYLHMCAIESDESGGGDIEMGKAEQDEPACMKGFYNIIDEIKAELKFVKKSTAEISKLSEEASCATSNKEEQALSKKLELIVKETYVRATKAKNLLELLKEETENLKAEGILEHVYERYVVIHLICMSTEDLFYAHFSCFQLILRIRENCFNACNHKFINEMKNYLRAQQDYVMDIQKKLKVHEHIVKPDATDKKVDTFMGSERGRDTVCMIQTLEVSVSNEIM